ncbi:MAG: chemotaxis protein CheW [Actinomycetes bacterium]
MDNEVIVRVEGLRYALPMAVVLRVVRAVDVTGYPSASARFCGVIDIAGEVVPVVDLRWILGVDLAPIEVDSAMLVVLTSRAKLVLPVDQVLGVGRLDEATHPEGTSLHADCINAFLCDQQGLVFGIDVERLADEKDLATFAFTSGGVGLAERPGGP